MFQLVSKISILSFLLSFTIAVGMQNVCDDFLLLMAAHSDGEVKNNLQKINKFFKWECSINNRSFLLSLDLSSIAEQDKENVFLKALWNDDQEIVNHYKDKCYLPDQIIIKPCFESELCKFMNLNCEIDLETIQDIKGKMADINSNKKELYQLSYATKVLQMAALCSDETLVKKVSPYIAQRNNDLSLNSRYWSIRTLLLQAMKQNQMSIFKSLITMDPFKVFGNDNNLYLCATLCGDLLDATIHQKRKDQFFQAYQETLTIMEYFKNKTCMLF